MLWDNYYDMLLQTLLSFFLTLEILFFLKKKNLIVTKKNFTYFYELIFWDWCFSYIL